VPELPEVETIRRDLAGELRGRRITGVRIHHDDIVMSPSAPGAFAERVTGARIEELERRAKYLLLDLGGDGIVQIQLRMTGRFALGAPPPDRDQLTHLAAEFGLDDGRTLFYDDTRRLGGFRLLTREAWSLEEERLGPEPLEAAFRPAVLGAALASRRAPVKNVLLDQRRVAGLGNIYASEALYRAGVDPRRPAGSLSAGEVERLHAAIRETLASALEHAGTTFSDYRAVNGRSGRFQERLGVYGRGGEPCRRCGAPIERIVQAGRSTFFCPTCQS
jgi:formamidopyrimidine-DNA glycosylase